MKDNNLPEFVSCCQIVACPVILGTAIAVREFTSHDGKMGVAIIKRVINFPFDTVAAAVKWIGKGIGKGFGLVVVIIMVTQGRC